MSLTQYYGTGRRKSSSARVFIRQPDGRRPSGIFVNNKPLDEYFVRDSLKLIIRQPLELVNLPDNYNIYVTVKGGGLSGQAGAIRLGISRALVQYDAELRPSLKGNGFLTRDSRKVERKKYGQPGARKRFQFSKR